MQTCQNINPFFVNSGHNDRGMVFFLERHFALVFVGTKINSVMDNILSALIVQWRHTRTTDKEEDLAKSCIVKFNYFKGLWFIRDDCVRLKQF